jgi:thiol:disulfide interchange protein
MAESFSHVSPTPRPSWVNRALYSVVLLALIAIQWPLLKGLYYKQFATQVSETQSVPWRTNFDQARQESERTGKPLLVDFTASWCPPCQVMKHEVWTDEKVLQKATDFVPVLLDIDLPSSRPLVQQYGIKAIPAVLVLDPAGKVKNQASTMDVDATLEFLSATQPL